MLQFLNLLLIGLDVSSDLPILPEIKLGGFDTYEDQRLWQLYVRQGPKWKKIQALFPRRTTA
jgi:hypothetical protein